MSVKMSQKEFENMSITEFAQKYVLFNTFAASVEDLLKARKKTLADLKKSGKDSKENIEQIDSIVLSAIRMSFKSLPNADSTEV